MSGGGGTSGQSKNLNQWKTGQYTPPEQNTSVPGQPGAEKPLPRFEGPSFQASQPSVPQYIDEEYEKGTNSRYAPNAQSLIEQQGSAGAAGLTQHTDGMYYFDTPGTATRRIPNPDYAGGPPPPSPTPQPYTPPALQGATTGPYQAAGVNPGQSMPQVQKSTGFGNSQFTGADPYGYTRKPDAQIPAQAPGAGLSQPNSSIPEGGPTQKWYDMLNSRLSPEIRQQVLSGQFRPWKPGARVGGVGPAAPSTEAGGK